MGGVTAVVVAIVAAVVEGQRRQAYGFPQPLAVRIGAAVLHPCGEFAAGGRALLVDGAMYAFLAEFAAQGNAAVAAVFGALHAGAQRAYLADEFRRNAAAAFAGDFAAIERHPEMRAAGAAAQARVGDGGIIGRRPPFPGRDFG